MSNAFTFGRNQYPTTTEYARHILDKFKPTVPIVTKKKNNNKPKWKGRQAKGLKTVQEEDANDDNILFTTIAEGKFPYAIIVESQDIIKMNILIHHRKKVML